MSEPLKFISGFKCLSLSNILVLYISREKRLDLFKTSVANGQKMSENVSGVESDLTHECTARTDFMNLPSSCLSIVSYIDISKDYNYSSSDKSFDCTVCDHGYRVFS